MYMTGGNAKIILLSYTYKITDRKVFRKCVIILLFLKNTIIKTTNRAVGSEVIANQYKIQHLQTVYFAKNITTLLYAVIELSPIF